MMIRLSVLGLGACAAICMWASPTRAKDIAPNITINPNDIDLRCSSYVGRDGPWAGALNYRINLSDSTVNGEHLQVDRIEVEGPTPSEYLQVDRSKVRGPKLRWHRPANASVRGAYYLLDLSKGRLDVTSEDDGQSFRLRCTRKLLKLAV
jgi:hypothetical protein